VRFVCDFISVFKKSYIPRTLDTAYNFEEDVFKILRGEETDVMYHKVLGLKADLTGAEEVEIRCCLQSAYN
jgi:hypothetical protein